MPGVPAGQRGRIRSDPGPGLHADGGQADRGEEVAARSRGHQHTAARQALQPLGGQGVDRGLVGRVSERWVKLIGIGVGWEAKEWTGAWSDGSVSVG